MNVVVKCDGRRFRRLKTPKKRVTDDGVITGAGEKFRDKKPVITEIPQIPHENILAAVWKLFVKI